MGTPHVRFLRDDFSGADVRALISRHLSGMQAISPPQSVHAFPVAALQQPDVRFYTAWVADRLAGCGALKLLDAQRGELKSMRVADDLLGQGIGRAILEHLLADARSLKLETVWLETGSAPEFTPALKLYESAGFKRTQPFGSYRDDPFSVFMTRSL